MTKTRNMKRMAPGRSYYPNPREDCAVRAKDVPKQLDYQGNQGSTAQCFCGGSQKEGDLH